MQKQNILIFENRNQLFKFLIDDFNLYIIDEKYDSVYFGNFYIVLSANEFLLRYVNDRSFLTIEISSMTEPSNWYALSFVRDLINNVAINSNERELDNSTRIEGLNLFLKNDFDRIRELFNDNNYSNTKKILDDELKRQFNLRFPPR